MTRLASGIIAALGITFLLIGCAEQSEPSANPIEAALANSARPETDVERDATRKPLEILSFFGVEPGMTVVEIFAGGGYYTEILNTLVGSNGKVIAHNNEGYLAFAEDELAIRFADGRLANVERYTADANEMDYGEGTADVVLMILGYHDIYYRPEDDSWPTIDEDAFLGSIVRAIKPGGVLGVVDHAADAGTAPESGQTVHRIDPALVIAKLTGMGLVLDDASDVLANPEDDRSVPMWDPSIRGNTDRFVFRFKKPARG
jgi:predicted methyltransferase